MAGNPQLSIELLDLLVTLSASQNVLYSPIGVATCLGLILAGSRGETAAEIAAALKSSRNVEQLLQKVLEKYNNCDFLNIANKVYIRKGCVARATYLKHIESHYQADLESIDFDDSTEAARKINQWINAKTGGKISELVSSKDFDSHTAIVLLNCLHFHGKWLTEFDVDCTKERTFWISEKDFKNAFYMQNTATFPFGIFRDLECTVLELPYNDMDLSMLVLLPEERSGLKMLLDKLKSANLVELFASMKRAEVNVKLPKFKVSHATELKEALQKLGVCEMFKSSAELCELFESLETLYVTQIVQKAVIDVTEAGTEAVAASAVIASNAIPQRFYADHPFVYIIWNKMDIFFAGVLINP